MTDRKYARLLVMILGLLAGLFLLLGCGNVDVVTPWDAPKIYKRVPVEQTPYKKRFEELNRRIER